MFMFVLLSAIAAYGQCAISGTVTEKETGEPIIGATVKVEGKSLMTATDLDGKFMFQPLKPGRYTVVVEMITYAPCKITDVEVAQGKNATLVIPMTPSSEALAEVEVIGYRRLRSDVATIGAIRQSTMVASGIGSESIKRTQDRDAGEVVKRIPGISIMNDKFVIVRGLSQRYNNVWVNNAAVPSSEADSRAFSFDLIPAGQIENIMILKSPAPEIPADFTGGFVKITTRDTPDEQPLSASLAVGYNTDATFKDFLYAKGSATDWLGFDNGLRGVDGGITGKYDNKNTAFVDRMTRAGFNNDWAIKKRNAIPDLKFNIAYGHGWNLDNGGKFTLNGALNYSYSTTIYDNKENSRYGIYNVNEDRPEYLYKYTDNMYQNSVKWGAMLNLAWMRGASKITFRNIFNQIGQSRLTRRSGWQNISSLYNQEKTEYLYTSRSAYCGQLAGVHRLGAGDIDWEAGYSYANKNQPDRRIINRQENDFVGDPHFGQMMIEQNSIERNFVKLDEHVASAAANYRVKFETGHDNFLPELKVGALLQYRSRDYKQRSFFYRYNPAAFGDDFPYGDPVGDILVPGNYGSDRLYLFDDTDNRNSYKGNEMHWAAYAAVNLPLNPLNIYAGVRLEQTRMTLTSYTKIYDWDTRDYHHDYFDVFPSINATYNLNEKQLIRAAYGMSTNRPEFREVSPSVYYDFELFSDIKGNTALKNATIHNADLRWEWYPANGESVSVALFYKHFRNPIESTFIDAGGSYTYTFENADRANVYGIELDVRKNLGFIRAPWLLLTLNASLIKSKVSFGDESVLEHDRQMQGQSPYLINAGLFYQPQDFPLSAGVLYNRIGKRIVGIGRTDMSTGGSINNDIPDMYEMPRNAMDLVVGYTFAGHYELRLNVKDVFNEDVEFCQFPKYENADGSITERKQVTRRFNPGTQILLSFNVKF